MSDIQRYDFVLKQTIEGCEIVAKRANGIYVKHKDHLKAIEGKEWELKTSKKYHQGVIDALSQTNADQAKAIGKLEDEYTKLWAMYGEKEEEIEELKAENKQLNLQIARLTTDDFIDSDFLNKLDFKDLEICNLKSALDEALQNYWHEGDERWQYFKRLIEQN